MHDRLGADRFFKSCPHEQLNVNCLHLRQI